MKKTIVATCTKTFEIEIPDDRCDDEAIASFESYMFELDDYDCTKQESLFRHTARCLHMEESFVEGIGAIAHVNSYPSVKLEAGVICRELGYAEWEYEELK